MAFDIDIKNLTGDVYVPAAGEQQNFDTNSYHQESGEYPVIRELLEPEVKSQVNETQEPESNPNSDNFRAFREEVDRMKAERDAEKKELQMQIELLRANMEHRNSPQSQQPEKKFLDGMNDNDVPNVAELRKEWDQRESMYQAKLDEMQVAQAHPDYAEVIEKFVLPLVKQKPHLAEGLHGAKNKALFAYELGKMAQSLQTPPPSAPQRSENAQRIVENSKKPGTLSQAGGQGALSKADYFASMSDQEFMKMASRNLDSC